MDNTEELHAVMNTAIAAICEIYKDEALSEVEVEEIERESATLERDRGDWLITVGFTRQKPRPVLGGLAIPQRILKVVRVDPYTQQFKGMKNRNPNT
jgi:hypothetical protein